MRQSWNLLHSFTARDATWLLVSKMIGPIFLNDNQLHNINECFKARKMSSFWNQIKNRRQKQRINSSLDAHQLAEYYKGTMGSDNTPLTPCQCQINNVVRDTVHEWVGSPQHTVFARCAKMCLPVLMVSQLSILFMETLKY